MTGSTTSRAASSLEELLSLHDEAFVRAAYLTVLGRNPDPDGFSHFVGRIRNGDSRHAILADLRFSPEGSQKEDVLPGLDRAIRAWRWRRLPLLGAVFRFLGAGEARVDVQRQVASIEARLHRLARLVPSATALAKAAKPDARAAEPPARARVPSGMKWRIVRQAAAAGEPRFARAETARALAELGLEVGPDAPGFTADVSALFTFPAEQADAHGGTTVLVGHDWDEKGYPADWVEQVNQRLSGIACVSSHAVKVLVDHGVQVPLAAVGFGVDHWERVYASPDYRAPGKRFRFLHVSACGPAQGIDLLLEAFGRSFGGADDVSLIIKPLGPAPRGLSDGLARLRALNPAFPDVVVLDEPLDDADLKALYGQCHAFVAPSRAGDFGLPIAQALLCGLPVAVTAWGGHRDYCDSSNAWLIDCAFARAGIPDASIGSVWVEPQADSLDQALWLAYRAESAERRERAASGRKRLMERFTWKEVALRLAALAKRCKADIPAGQPKFRVGWVTTWNVKCGIATHVEHLLASLSPDEFVVFAARQEPQVRQDEPNCLRIWTPGKEANGLDEITRQLAARSIGALVIQFNYAFYNHFELNAFIEEAIAKGIVVLVELHSTVDPFGDAENFRLKEFLGALRKCHRILVHSPVDLDRLKELGLVDNVMLFPHGVMNRLRERTLPANQGHPPLIASFGFCFSNKGLVELVEAVGVLKREGKPVRLLMLNAEHPSPETRSAEEVLKIKDAIGKLGLQDDVELHTEFLEDEVCLTLLGNADLVVNPYQRTGESASGSARYGLTIGRPTAVTPLAIFDDLGDAVFRLPGTGPREIARGIADALGHLREDTETAARVRNAARRWLETYDYSRQVIDLMRTVRALARPQKVARGVFINTAAAVCSIYESGRMVYNCIRESGAYTLDYFSLDMIDVPVLVDEGRIKPLDAPGGGGAEALEDYDFWVFNWHFLTMAPHVGPESIRKLPGRKFTVVLELEPDNPLALVPPDTFDGFIALDPTAAETGRIFAFPRPLEGEPRDAPRVPRDVPVIGSFGFGTPGKGFELLVEAVNREFDRAVVRVNIPVGSYTSSTDAIHWQPYAAYLASLCKKLAKPGVEVRFTHDYMSPEELVDWCADNDLNCFMYTRRQSGLSATTDQAIMSGRPLLTLTNDTFRHIHRYIPPYPVLSLREAMATTVPMVRRMQRDWSRAAFGQTFHRMLAAFGLVRPSPPDGNSPVEEVRRPVTVMVASRPMTNPDDIAHYPARVANCLGRTGHYRVLRVYCDQLPELQKQVEALRPSAAIVVGFAGTGRDELAAALQGVQGPGILLADEGEHPVQAGGGLHLLPRRPVIPYFTSAAGLRSKSPSIWLVGFSARESNLEEVVAKIAREFADAELFLETTEAMRSEFEARAARLRERLSLPQSLNVEVHAMPIDGGHMIATFTVNHLTIFYNDPARTEELENASSLAMTTERAVAFTRAALFPRFRGGGTCVEDCPIADIIRLGMAAQIGLYHEFGEWQLYAGIHRLLAANREATGA